MSRSSAPQIPNSRWLWIKAAITGVTAAVVIGGSATALSRPLNEGSAGAALLLLLPATVYATGIRTPRYILIFGAIMLSLTLLTWVLFFMQRKESMAGVGILMGSVWSLAAAVGGAAVDRDARRG